MRFWSFLCTMLVSSIVAAALAMLFHPRFRSYPAEFIVSHDHPAKGADAIVLLMGDAIDRAPHAAKLLRAGYGSKIVFVETETDELIDAGLKPKEGQLVYDYLTKTLRVSPSSILFEDKSRVSSSREEAQVLLKLLDKNRMYRNILSTSWYHSSRAAWIFAKVQEEKVGAGKEKDRGERIKLEDYPTPMPTKWYQKERDFLSVFNEYLKWAYYYIKYELIV